MNNAATDIERRISPDRKRTNLLRVPEQATIAFLCRVMPAWVSPDMLTATGLLASGVVFWGFWLAKGNPYYFAVSIAGFALQWFGDSLDGRIAYYRNIQRKWYGFSLDLSMDWISTVLMGAGFYVYLGDEHKMLAYIFIAAYGWTMLLAMMKFKITGNYSIDSGLFGPTELRIGICGVLLSSMFYPAIITVFAIGLMGIVMIINLVEFRKVLQLGNQRDQTENGKQGNR